MTALTALTAAPSSARSRHPTPRLVLRPETGRLSRKNREQAHVRRSEYASQVRSEMLLRERMPPQAEPAETPEPTTSPSRERGGGRPCLVLSFRGDHLTSAEYEHTSQLWDWTKGTRVRSMPELSSTTTVIGVATSPDGTRLASGSADGLVSVRHAQRIDRCRHSPRPVCHTSGPADGWRCDARRRPQVHIYDASSRTYDARSKSLLRVLRAPAPTAGGSRGGGSGGRARSPTRRGDIFEARAAPQSSRASEERRAAVSSVPLVLCVAFSPDGSHLAGGGDRGEVWIWELASGEVVGTFRGHKGHVLSVAYSADGALLASGGQDQTVRIWSADAPQPAVLGGLSGPVLSVRFNGDGRRLYTGTFAGDVVVRR